MSTDGGDGGAHGAVGPSGSLAAEVIHADGSKAEPAPKPVTPTEQAVGVALLVGIGMSLDRWVLPHLPHFTFGVK